MEEEIIPYIPLFTIDYGSLVLGKSHFSVGSSNTFNFIVSTKNIIVEMKYQIPKEKFTLTLHDIC